MGRKNAFKLDVVSVRLVRDAPIYSDAAIEKPEEAVSLVGEVLCGMDREVVCVLNLGSDGKPINCNFASMGALNYSMAHPRELLKTSILSNAASMLLVHNHPTGRLIPSKEDITITDRMLKLGELVGIPLADHIIVGGDNREYFSFKNKGILKNACIHYAVSPEYLNWGHDAIIQEKGGKGR